MPFRARRDLVRSWHRSARRAWLTACIWLAALVACASASAEILAARFAAPTDRYPHAVLGDALEWGALVIESRPCAGCAVMRAQFVLDQDHVFEDLVPRLVDLDLDTVADAVMVVESDARKGGALALYDAQGKIAETPHIGTRFRWLAPVAAADLDGDGRVELAYIDRPHLAKTLRIWRLDGHDLRPVADQPGLTNHKIGEDFITGGLRDCGMGPELITVDARWRQIMASRLVAGQIDTRPVAAFDGQASVRAALGCGG